MYHLMKGIHLYATSKEEYSILLLGLDNAGKTTLFEQIKTLYSSHGHPNLDTVPTVGQNVTVVTLPDMYLKIWDVGGQHALRPLWQDYYSSCHAIVFVIDSSDVGDANIDLLATSSSTLTSSTRTQHLTESHSGSRVIMTQDDGRMGRLDECREMLETVLESRETEGVPLLVLANKQDRDDCVGVVNIKEGFVRKVVEGQSGRCVRDSRVFPCKALTGEGVREAVEWLSTRVKWNKKSRPPVMR